VVGNEVTPLRTGLLNNSRMENVVYSLDVNDGNYRWSKPGHRAYSVFALAPFFSLMYADHTRVDKMSGLCSFQTDNPDQAVFTLTDFVALEGYTMSDMYGTDGTSISSNNCVYATDINFHLMAPGATSSGTVTWCRIPAASMIDNEHQSELSINEIMKSKYKVMNVTDTNRSFKLSNALVDDALVRYISH